MSEKKEENKITVQKQTVKNTKTLLSSFIDNVPYILCVLLVLFAVYQQKQINGLQVAVTELLSQEVNVNPKIAVISFDDTVDSWAKLDPTGNLGRKAIGKSVELYNSKGYLILDADAIIGGVGFAEFINVTPEAIKNQQKVERSKGGNNE